MISKRLKIQMQGHLLRHSSDAAERDESSSEESGGEEHDDRVKQVVVGGIKGGSFTMSFECRISQFLYLSAVRHINETCASFRHPRIFSAIRA
jgi:hypothetical protein